MVSFSPFSSDITTDAGWNCKGGRKREIDHWGRIKFHDAETFIIFICLENSWAW